MEKGSVLMDLLIALIPPLFFGPLGVMLALIGGTVRQQTIGEMCGALIVALCALPFLSPHLTLITFLVPFLGGMTCALGIFMQLYSFRVVGVSRTMPISTGLQLIIMALSGVLIFHEWNQTLARILGVIGLGVIVAGIILTSYTDGTDRRSDPGEVSASSRSAGASAKTVDVASMRRGMLINVISSVFLCGYMVWIRMYDIGYHDFIVPLALGLTVGGFVVAGIFRDGQPLWNRTTLRLLIPGILFGCGVFSVQITNSIVGVATGFTFSQLGVIISVAGGILWLGETKSRRELRAAILGVALVILGAAIIGYTKTMG
ncbi:GRP family sugar transporter [Trueperella sp. LYQ143]|uniref:GRP family sugar transporter n=1 Tax=unclassified Trueperella TaxID=2630174 RepID=UPI003982D800